MVAPESRITNAPTSITSGATHNGNRRAGGRSKELQQIWELKRIFACQPEIIIDAILIRVPFYSRSTRYWWRLMRCAASRKKASECRAAPIASHITRLWLMECVINVSNDVADKHTHATPEATPASADIQQQHWLQMGHNCHQESGSGQGSGPFCRVPLCGSW